MTLYVEAERLRCFLQHILDDTGYIKQSHACRHPACAVVDLYFSKTGSTCQNSVWCNGAFLRCDNTLDGCESSGSERGANCCR